MVPDELFVTIFLLVISEIVGGRFLTNVEFAFLAKDASNLVNLQRLIIAGARCGLAAALFLTLHHWNLRAWSYASSCMTFVLVFVLLTGQVRLYGATAVPCESADFSFGTSFALVQFAYSISHSADKVALSFVLSFDQIGLYNAGARMLSVAQVPAGLILRDNYSKFFRAGLAGFDERSPLDNLF